MMRSPHPPGDSPPVSSYHTTVKDVYRDAAQAPAEALCCVPQAPMYLPGLTIPGIMHDMNYGCGSTVHPQDMKDGQRVLYVGVGGGLEALQLAYFARHAGGVIAIDPVAEMRDAARKNLEEAARLNDWFDPSFVDIRDGDALHLPVEDESVDLAAQNCLFNIFKTGEGEGDLERALSEVHRVLRKNGRLSMSDPVTPVPLPEHLQQDEVLRAQCISGCQTYDVYMQKILDAGFGSAEVRSRRPYRMLDRKRYRLEQDILLESIEVCAFKIAAPPDGACVFTGQTAIYVGEEPTWDDGQGHLLRRDIPLPVCDKTAGVLKALGREDIMVTPPTWHYGGDGCC